MTGKIHVAIGTASLACLCVMCPGGFELQGVNVIPMLGLVSAGAGSYAPDIDLGTTHASHEHKVLSKLVTTFTGHRGFTHTLVIPAAVFAIMFFYLQICAAAGSLSLPKVATSVAIVNMILNALLSLVQALLVSVLSLLPALGPLLVSLLFGFLWGYVWHILADMCNGKGCPVLWPIYREKIHIMDVPSSGKGAWVFAVVLIVLMNAATFGGIALNVIRVHT